MEAWESPYMHALADTVAKDGGHMLEVGFGMGLSAERIQSNPKVTKHTIIEINKDVYDTALEFKESHPTVNPLHGDWKAKLAEVEDGSVDGVFYDPYPSGDHDQHTHQFDFLKAVRDKIKVGGRLTYCNLTSLGVLKSLYKDAASSRENWAKLMEETQIPHLLEAGWKREEIEFDVYKLPESAIHERDSVGCEYYNHDECLVPYLVKGSD